MTRQCSFFINPSSSSPSIELEEPLLNIRNRILRVLGECTKKEEMVAVFEKIFSDNLYPLLAEFATYCRNHPTPLNRLCYHIITSPLLEDFWEKKVITTTEGIKQFYATVFLDTASFKLTDTGYKPWSNRSEYLFNLLSGTLYASQAHISKTIAEMIKCRVTTEGISVEEMVNKITLPTHLSEKISPPDPTFPFPTSYILTMFTHNFYSHNSFIVALYYAFWEIKAILTAKAKSHLLTKLPIDEPLSALRKANRASPEKARGYFFTLTAAFLHKLGQSSAYLEHLTNYFPVDEDYSRSTSYLCIAFRFYAEGNYELGSCYFRQAIENGPEALSFSSLKSLKRSLELMQLNSPSYPENIAVLDYAIAELNKCFNEAESKPPQFTFRSQLEAALLLHYLHRRRAFYYQKLTEERKKNIVKEWKNQAKALCPPAKQLEIIIQKLDPDNSKRLTATPWKKLFQRKWEEISEISELDRSQLELWRKIAIATDPYHPKWQATIESENSAGWEDLLRAQLNKEYSDNAAEGWLDRAKVMTRDEKETNLILSFENIDTAESPSFAPFEELGYYYCALHTPSFTQAINYGVKLANSSAANPAQKDAVGLALSLIYLENLDSAKSSLAAIINDKSRASNIAKEKTLIYHGIIKKLQAIYESNNLSKGHCIARLIQHIYAEKLRLSTEAALWGARALADQTAAESELKSLGVKAEYQKLANPKHPYFFTDLLQATKHIATQYYNQHVLSLAESTLPSLFVGLEEKLTEMAAKKLEEGVAVANFYCLNKSATRLLQQLNQTIEAPNQDLLNRLVELGERAAKYHGSIGYCLLAKIQMKIAERFYNLCRPIYPKTYSHDFYFSFAKAYPIPETAAPDDIYRQSINYGAAGLTSYTIAQILKGAEAPEKEANALYGIKNPFVAKLKEMVAQFKTRIHPSLIADLESRAAQEALALIASSTQSTRLKA